MISIFRYFDILILVTARKKENHEKIEQELEAIIDAEEEIKMPVTLIVHDLYYVNQQLQKTYYFFQISKDNEFHYTIQSVIN